MIRQYNGKPRFDEGFDQTKYNQDILNQAVQMYDQQRAANNLSMNAIDAMNDYPPRPNFMDIDPSSLIQPEAKKRYSGTSSSQRTRRTTTGAEDMKAAENQYNAAASAARKKQAAEVKQAVQTLKDNGVIGAEPASRPKYHSYANQGRGRYELLISNAARREQIKEREKLQRASAERLSQENARRKNSTFSRPRMNIPGQSSDSGAKQYWAKRKALIAAQKKRNGQDSRDIFTMIKDWAKRNGIGRKRNYGPVVTTRGVGSYR